MATATASSEFPSTRDTARPGFFRRFFAALVDARMRAAEAHVLRARRLHGLNNIIEADLERLAPAKPGKLPLGS